MKISKNIRELLITASIIGLLYTTGWYVEVAAFTQKMVLQSGLLQANASEKTTPADFNLDLIALDGSKSSLKDSKGKVIFINFWASWCAPCIAEMDGIHSLYEKTKGKNVEFVMISLDKDINKAKKFIKKKGYTFPVYQPGSAIPKIYTVRSIPATYVVDAEGSIVVEKIGMANYNNKKFEKLLLEKAQRQ